MFKKPLVTPHINLNGDNPTTLINQLIDIRSCLFQCMGKMRSASTHHGRNFQTIPNAREMQGEAQDAWNERVQMMLNLYHELGTMSEMIDQQRSNQPKPPVQ